MEKNTHSKKKFYKTFQIGKSVRYFYHVVPQCTRILSKASNLSYKEKQYSF